MVISNLKEPTNILEKRIWNMLNTEKIKYNLAKRFLRFSTDSALVYMTYKIVYQVEIDNLKHIIEGLRYGETPSQIESMLIY